MGLDIYLYGPEEEVECTCPECGLKHFRKQRPCLFECSITHNLGRMAREAGIYDPLWHPEDIEIFKAGQLIETLSRVIAIMKSDPERFEKHNPSNGWGTYHQFIPWLERYLNACREYPNAEIRVSG